MTEGSSSTSRRVVIVGGGVAGLEALLALRSLAGDRVTLSLISADERFVDRPVTVAEPFGLASAMRHSLPDITAELGAQFVHAKVARVDAGEHRVSPVRGPDIGFDTLILAPGAQTSPPFAEAIAFGLEGSGQAVREMLGRMRSNEIRSVAFVAPNITGWLLPLYELALMCAHELTRSQVRDVELRVVTPEEQPLTLFGRHGSNSVARLLDGAGIEFIGATNAAVQGSELTLGPGAGSFTVDAVVTLPLLRGPGLSGVPATEPHDFLPVDAYGQVEGLADVYAAGDAIDFPVKQGGLAAQQADTVAEHVAARCGAGGAPAQFRPVLRGMLFTGGQPRFLRSDAPGADPDVTGAGYPLWWPPTKVAGRYLAPYLFGRTDVEWLGRHPEGFTDVDIPLTAATLPG